MSAELDRDKSQPAALTVRGILLRLLIAILAIPLVAAVAFVVWLVFAFNWSPPKMFSEQFPTGKHRDREATDAAITEILIRTFPSGSLASLVRASLLDEGFSDVPPPPPDCVPSSTKMPVGTTFRSCYDNRNQMEYTWSMGLVCGGHINVKWTTDEAGKIIRIEGHDWSVCL